MTYDKLREKVSKLLEDTEEKMNDLIEEYNESIEAEQLSWPVRKKRLSWSARDPTVWRQPSPWRRQAWR